MASTTVRMRPGVDGHGAASDETLREARLSEIDENERHGVALI